MEFIVVVAGWGGRGAGNSYKFDFLFTTKLMDSPVSRDNSSIFSKTKDCIQISIISLKRYGFWTRDVVPNAFLFLSFPSGSWILVQFGYVYRNTYVISFEIKI